GVERADRMLAPPPAEAAHVVGLYGADPGRIRIVPGGVDHQIFFPRSRQEAKRRLHLAGVRLVLFVGRLQAHKGPDVAVRAMAEAVARDPATMSDVVLAVVRGPSGGSDPSTEVARLMVLGSAAGVRARAMVLPPQPRRARRMGEAATVHALRFSWDVTAGEILAVYRELLGARDAEVAAS